MIHVGRARRARCRRPPPRWTLRPGSWRGPAANNSNHTDNDNNKYSNNEHNANINNNNNNINNNNDNNNTNNDTMLLIILLNVLLLLLLLLIIIIITGSSRGPAVVYMGIWQWLPQLRLPKKKNNEFQRSPWMSPLWLDSCSKKKTARSVSWKYSGWTNFLFGSF